MNSSSAVIIVYFQKNSCKELTRQNMIIIELSDETLF